MARQTPHLHPVTVRYLEVDQQGVVFNMWYLGYFDDAMTTFLEAGGLPYTEMADHGYDIQLVHHEIDWTGPLRFGDDAHIQVSVAEFGRTSFTMHFVVEAPAGVVARGTTVYVAIALDGSGPMPIPDRLRGCLLYTSDAADE